MKKDPFCNAEDKETKTSGFKISLSLLLVILVVFGLIVLFTDLLGNFFGKSAEIAGLIIIAVVLVIFLIKSKRS